MKSFMLSGLLFLLVLELPAQDSYFGINLGSSMPKNDFEATTNLATSGYALNGFSIQFDGIYFPVRFVGFGGLVGFGSIYPDRDSYLTNFVQYLSTNPSFAGLSVPMEEEFDISSGFWNYFNIMAGPELAVEVGRFQAGVRVMGGGSLLIYPRMEIGYVDDFDEINLLADGSSLSLGYMYGGSLMFKLNRGSSLKLSADYFSTNSRYDFELDVDGLIGTVIEIKQQEVKIDVLHISLGLHYLF
ncbi:MAG TPA: hypothetical protein VMW76_08600 [Bacteroidales bacterium]|nr:hypothetical protein [Bacteroidales bacterium]